MTIHIDNDSIRLLEKIYESSYYLISMETPESERQTATSLGDANLLRKIKHGYDLTVEGIIFLAEYGNRLATDVIDTLDIFLTSCSGKIKWSGEDLREYIQTNSIEEKVFRKAINLGEKTKHISVMDSRIFIHGITIKKRGEFYNNDLLSMYGYLHLNERNFKIEFNDNSIIDWILFSSNSSEDFEIEYKLQVTQQRELKRIFHGFANSQSGILIIGVNDEGQIIGLDSPDEEVVKISNAINNLKMGLDIRIRVLKNDDNKKILFVMVPRGKDVLFSGDDVIIRSGSSFRRASNQEIVKITTSKIKEANGHLWIKSLRQYQRKKEK